MLLTMGMLYSDCIRHSDPPPVYLSHSYGVRAIMIGPLDKQPAEQPCVNPSVYQEKEWHKACVCNDLRKPHFLCSAYSAVLRGAADMMLPASGNSSTHGQCSFDSLL